MKPQEYAEACQLFDDLELAFLSAWKKDKASEAKRARYNQMTAMRKAFNEAYSYSVLAAIHLQAEFNEKMVLLDKVSALEMMLSIKEEDLQSAIKRIEALEKEWKI